MHAEDKNHSDPSPDGQHKPIKDTGSKDIKRVGKR